MKIENSAIFTGLFDKPSSRFGNAALSLSVGFDSQPCGKSCNEDFFGMVVPSDDEVEAKGIIVAIADGVSGTGAGRVASEAAVRTLLFDYYGISHAVGVSQALEKLLRSMNSWFKVQGERDSRLEGMATALSALVVRGKRDSRLEGMATALSALVVRGKRYFIAHVGDTRVYLLRAHEITQLTTDHVWMQRGMQHVLRRALGLDHHLVVDFIEGDLQAGDLFLLVSDGVWEVIGAEAVARILALYHDPQLIASTLVDNSIQREAEYKGRNDATAIVVRVDTCRDH
jgi:serine/threonine protein phosphatase PrpC